MVQRRRTALGQARLTGQRRKRDHWHNTRRLHSYLDNQPPAEYEQTFYAAHRDDPYPVGISSAGLHQTQDGSV
jgi:hypothetical protein